MPPEPDEEQTAAETSTEQAEQPCRCPLCRDPNEPLDVSDPRAWRTGGRIW